MPIFERLSYYFEVNAKLYKPHRIKRKELFEIGFGMKTIRVENFRAIEDSGTIELKPITIAVGRNSAGKSSFIRLFPLLKQTLEKKTAEPILWYGDYVDFGDFQQAVSKANSDKPIHISIEIDTRKIGSYAGLRVFSEAVSSINVSLSVKDKYFSNITIQFKDQSIEINSSGPNRAQIVVNGDNTIFEGEEIVKIADIGDLIPELYQGGKFKNDLVYMGLMPEELIRKFEQYVFSTKGDDDRRWRPYYRSRGIAVGSKEEMLARFRQINKEKFESKSINSKLFLRYNNYFIAICLPEIINAINAIVREEMRQTRYIKPIRAMVDRYYRVQGISISELDADGSNLPMILKNMSDIELKGFEQWSKETFGIIFSVKKNEGHISLVIKDNLTSDEGINVADTGYGYSQMLPIVMLLWMIRSRRAGYIRNLRQTVVIEQPELHLHPAYQAKMMDVFVNILSEAKKYGCDLKIIFETHSETMINRLGSLVARGIISKDDINILVFDKQKSNTVIHSKGYDEDGVLRGWPIDFFAPEGI